VAPSIIPGRRGRGNQDRDPDGRRVSIAVLPQSPARSYWPNNLVVAILKALAACLSQPPMLLFSEKSGKMLADRKMPRSSGPTQTASNEGVADEYSVTLFLKRLCDNSQFRVEGPTSTLAAGLRGKRRSLPSCRLRSCPEPMNQAAMQR
jgi:hypothetical protein